MPHYYTGFGTTDDVDSAALNARFSELDDQIYAMAGGSGYEDQAANLIFAGPSSGADAAPTFRALAAADLTTPLTTPPAIGGTTPAAGTFTTLQANTSLLVDATGTIATFGSGSGAARIAIDGAAANERAARWLTNGSLRWAMSAETTAESGSDAGSDLVISRHNDSGVKLGDAVKIVRSSGAVTLENSLRINGNIGFYSTAPGAKPTVTGSRAANAALASLLTALAGLGLVTDSSS